MKTRIAIIGYGNIGKAVEQAVLAAEDMQLVGIFHHNDNLDNIDADVVALCTPTREVPLFAEKLLRRGICTVDSFDIHGQIYDLRKQLTPIAHCRWLGPGFRLYGACPTYCHRAQRHHLHELRSWTEHGAHSGGKSYSWREGRALDDYSVGYGHSSPHGLCGVRGRRRFCDSGETAATG